VKVIKTTFEKELQDKEEAWLKLTGTQRLEIAAKLINSIRDPSIRYSLQGQKVKVTRLP
jgi:hypothetical protein